MKFPKLTRSKPESVPDKGPPPAAPSWPHVGHVLECAVNVAQDGNVTFVSSLEPKDVFKASVVLVSWLSNEDRAKFVKLPSEAYSGVLLQFQDRPTIFLGNVRFFEFLQLTIASVGPHLPDLQALARETQRRGGLNIFIYDARVDPWLRNHPGEMPSDSEAIGCFRVLEGRVTTDSYLRNTRYNRWSPDGPTRVPVAFYDAFVEQLHPLGASSHPA
jgi:hypothetical protein